MFDRILKKSVSQQQMSSASAVHFRLKLIFRAFANFAKWYHCVIIGSKSMLFEFGAWC